MNKNKRQKKVKSPNKKERKKKLSAMSRVEGKQFILDKINKYFDFRLKLMHIMDIVNDLLFIGWYGILMNK